MRLLPRRAVRPIASLTALALASLLPAPAHAAGGLGGLGLVAHDLRAGYIQQSAVYHPFAFVATDYHVVPSRLRAEGWRASFEEVFSRGSGALLAEVGNRLDQYAGPNGAHWGYRVVVENVLYGGRYRVAALPAIGQESTGYISTAGPSGFIGIKFREGPFVADVAVMPATKVASLLLLARTVDARLRTHLTAGGINPATQSHLP